MDPIQPQISATALSSRKKNNGEKADRTGQQLGTYRLLHLLADGGFAEVYLGEHIHLNTYAAIKVLHAQLVSEELEQFREEARIVARLRHPHIVSVLDFNVLDDTPFLVMDYAPNGTLRQRHLRNTIVPPVIVLSYLKQIADALQYAHNEKVIHRDIKPENMLIGWHNEILLSDFGIAIVDQSSRSQMTHDVIGTLAYMSPEQLQGKPGKASDQYSLGVVAYEWLCGEALFHGSVAEVAAQHINAAPPSLQERNADILPEVEAVIFKALAKQAEQRYPNMLDFVSAFEAAFRQKSLRIGEFSNTLSSLSTSPSAGAPAASPHFHLTATVRAEPLENLRAGAKSSNGTGKHGISRRTVLISLVGLSTTGLVGGGITWLAQQYAHRQAQKPHPKPTPRPTPTPTPIPVGTTLFTYFGHSDAVNSVAWSPQDGGTYIASGGKDHTVHVWYSGSGSDAHTAYVGHSDMVNAVAWSPDGKTIASGSADKTVQVWSAFPANGDPVPFSYTGHGDAVNAVAWSSDGTLIASASNDKTVQVWKSVDGSSPITYSNHTDAVNTAAWSPDQSMIASGSNDKTVRLWKASDGSDIRSYSGHTDAVRAVAWSPDGTYIASASADQTVQIWEAATGTLLFTYSGHSDVLNAVAWSLDGKRVASGGNDKTVQLWNFSDGSNAFSYQGHMDVVNAVAWSPGGIVMASASADKTVQEWQAV